SRSSNPRRCAVYSSASFRSTRSTSVGGCPTAWANARWSTGSSTIMRIASSAGCRSSGETAGVVVSSVSVIVVSRRVGARRGLVLTRGLVELVADVDVALVAAGPADRELAQRHGLVEGQHALAEQLEQRQEARDLGLGVRGVPGDRPEGQRPLATQ